MAEHPALRHCTERKDVSLPVSGYVICGGSRHMIEFDGRHLRLLHHTDREVVRRERELEKFGGRCRCLAVLRAWHNRWRGLLPEWLKPAFNAYRLRGFYERKPRRDDRWLVQQASESPLCFTTLRDALELHRAYVIQAVRQAIGKCNYTKGSRVRYDIRPSARAGEPAFVIHSNRPKPYPKQVLVWVRRAWDRRVLREGLAVVDGHFVFDVLHARDVEHVKALRRYRPAGGRSATDLLWWSCYGEDPDPALGPYVLVGRARNENRHVWLWPARVRTERQPDGTEVKKLIFFEAQDPWNRSSSENS